MTSPFQPAITEIDIDSLIRASKSRSAALKPVKKAASDQSGMVLMERSLMLAPLGLLAACGGSGIAASPAPAPSPGATNVPLNADTAAATVGKIIDAPTGAEANGNVFTNDTGLPSGFAISSVTASGGTAVPITSTAGQDVTSALGTLHIGTDGGYRFASSGATGAVALSHGLTSTQVFTINGAAGSATGNETLTVTVTGANHAPLDVSKTVSVQSTATKIDLSIATPTDSDLTATGASADILTISNVVGPTHGTLTDAAGNTVNLSTLKVTDIAGLHYVPNGAVQADSFSFVVDDGFGAANSKTTETISISINNGINLESLGTAGVKFTAAGGAAKDLLGYSIAAGTGTDGKDVLLIGAPGSSGGSVYVVNGGTGAVNGALVSPLVGTAGDRLGTSVAVADFNGDGKADILIGAPGSALSNAGLAYISYGTGSAFVIPNSLNGAGITINGTETGTAITANPTTTTAGGNLGYAVFSLGDINGDGKADYFVGSPGLNYVPPTGPSAGDNGIAIIGYGGAGTPGSSYNTGSFSSGSTIGLLASGDNKANVLFGQAAGSGDITGDAKTDLVFGSAHEGFALGATEATRVDAGRVSVFTGSLAASLSGTVIDNSSANLKIYGANGDKLGTSIAVGDVNGDGKADLIIGAPGHDTVYVVLGNAANTLAGGGLDLGGIGNSVASAATFDANGHASVGGLDVIRIVGAAGSGFGSSVAFLPNFNGDTYGDFAVGTNGATGYGYIIAGRGTAAFDNGINPTSANGSSVTLLKAIPSTAGGPSVNVIVASAGDINGDGLTDVGIGATTVATGSAYVVYGTKVGFVTPTSATISAQSAQGVVAHATATVDHVIQHYAPIATAAAAPTLHVNAVAADVLAVHTHIMFDPHMHVNMV